MCKTGENSQPVLGVRKQEFHIAEVFDASTQHFEVCKGYRVALTALLKWWLTDVMESVNKPAY